MSQIRSQQTKKVPAGAGTQTRTRGCPRKRTAILYQIKERLSI
nr:MAG TPA: hypothetical protein [Caudoviricetes sp.]